MTITQQSHTEEHGTVCVTAKATMVATPERLLNRGCLSQTPLSKEKARAGASARGAAQDRHRGLQGALLVRARV